MMGNTLMPVITDETAKGIMNAILSGNAGQREARDLIKEQNNLLGLFCTAMLNANGDIFTVLIKGTSTTTNGATSYNYQLDGTSFDEILAAYHDNKYIIARIALDECAYFATLADYTSRTIPIGTTQFFEFFAHTLPQGQSIVQVARTTKTSGSIVDSLAVHPSGIVANQISCNLKIGGIECYTLDAALNAIVDAL